MRFAEVRATRPAPHVEETVIPEPVEDADSDPSFDEHDADEEAWPDPGDQEQEEMRAET